LTKLGPEYGWARIPPFTWSDGSAIRLEAVALPDATRTRIYDATPGQAIRLKPVHIRGKAEYFVYADAARTLHFKVALRAVGRTPRVFGSLALRTPKGGTCGKVDLEPVFRKEQEVAFKVPKAGFYRLNVMAGTHVLYFTEADAPMALVMSETVGLPGWNGLPGEVYLRVPEGCGKFAISASGGGGNERVHVRLFDPNGKCAWDVDDIGGSEMWCSSAQPAAGLWKLSALRATKGCMDDYSFGVFGIPCQMFLSPEKTWQGN
jgi:hypothetical protein